MLCYVMLTPFWRGVVFWCEREDVRRQRVRVPVHIMAQRDGYVQLSEPAEVVERLPPAAAITFAPPLQMEDMPQGAAPAQQPMYPPVPQTQYPTVPTAAKQPDGQGVPLDLNGDGTFDAVGFDTNGDGKLDTIKLIGSPVVDPALLQPTERHHQIIEVVMPPAAFPGMTIVVQAPDGAKCKATVPAGVTPGGRLRVQMPTMVQVPVAQAPLPQPVRDQFIEVVIPAGCAAKLHPNT